MLAGASARLEDPSASIQSRGYVKHMVRLQVPRKGDTRENVPTQVLLGSLHLCINSYNEPERRGVH